MHNDNDISYEMPVVIGIVHDTSSIAVSGMKYTSI